MPLSAEDAFELSKQFRELSIHLGNYRFANWNNLSPVQRRELEDEEWSLLNASSDMTTKAIGLVLEKSEIDARSITQSVSKAKRAVKKLEKAGDVINVATASVGLAAAVVSKDPGAIAKNTKLVLKAADL